MTAVEYKSYSAPPINKKELLRYIGTKALDPEILSLLESVIDESEKSLSYRVCYSRLPVAIFDNICDFGIFKVNSTSLAKNLCDSDEVIIFAATVGVGIDRLLSKYSLLSPSRAVLLDAFGNERIEALCDRFCEDVGSLHNVGLGRRFSPGYGDLPLHTQREIFSLLSPTKYLGLSLTDSLLLTPSKSVTAFIGIKKG